MRRRGCSAFASRRPALGAIGKAPTERSAGGQRLVAAAEVARLLTERRERPRVTSASCSQSVPRRGHGGEADEVAATVEILAGPHRILALVTREAVDEMGLEPGMHAVATVKATNVMLEVDD